MDAPVDRRARSGGGQEGHQRCDQFADISEYSPGCEPTLILATAIFGIICTVIRQAPGGL
jgi:hypothetical protein